MNLEQLTKKFAPLWKEADEIWDLRKDEPAFGAYVSADYVEVLQALIDLKQQAYTFVEWGSGLGVVTIMASLLGYESYGIEAEAALVEFAEDLAVKWDSQAVFSVGSFIPDDFQWSPAAGHEAVRTMVDVPAAYDELDMEVRDFDLIYSYPWPTEHLLYQNILRDYGHPNSYLLTYDAREGIDVLERRNLNLDEESV